MHQVDFLKQLEFDPFKILNADPEKVLTEEQASEDIEFTKRILHAGYAGSKSYPGDTFPQLISDLDKMKRPQTVREFIDGINIAFSKFPDRHLNAIFKISKDNYISPPSVKYVPEIGLNVVTTNDKQVWHAELVDHRGKKVFILSILNFPYSTSEKWNGFKEAVAKYTPQAEIVIFDLRQNGGGDSTMGSWLAEFWFGSQPTSPFDRPLFCNSPEAFLIMSNSGIFGAYYFNEVQPSSDELEFTKKLKGLSERALAGEKIDLFKELTGSNGSTTSEALLPNKMKQPLYILMDKFTGSSGEITVDFFESFENAIRVGQNTYGAVHYGEVGWLVLPNSSVALNMGIGHHVYKDRRFIEKTGIKADVEVPEGEDALQVVYKLIDKLN